MKSQVFIVLFFLTLNFSCKNSSKEQTGDTSAGVESQVNTSKFSLENTWLLNSGLINVESIVYDRKNEFFYLSNGIDYKVGNDGFISKVSKNGELIKLKWVKGLNRPTGMAIHNNLLYVADVNALVIINIQSGEIIQSLMEPIENSGLNDVAINKDGEVFVTASFVHAIFHLRGGKLELWLHDDEKLQWANGIIVENENVIVAGMQLNSININTKTIDRLNLNPEAQDFDGIETDGLGNYYLTTVEKKAIWHLNGDKITMLKEADSYFGDLELIRKTKKLYIPRGNHKENKYFISVVELK